MSNPEPSEVRRLALIRHLFRRAKQQTQGPEPLAAMAVLSLHDAAEWFLYLVAEHVDASPPYQFMEYWEHIETQGGVSLTGKAKLRRLNGARKELKHRAVFPSRSDVQDFTDDVEAFLEENCMKVFDESFHEISLVQLVRPETTRDRLQEAQKRREEGEYEKAIGDAAIAFEVAYHSADLFGLGSGGKDLMDFPFVFGEPFEPRSFDYHDRKKEDPRFDELLERLQKTIRPMASTLRALTAGIDAQRYQRFRQLTPEVVGPTGDDSWGYHWHGFREPSEEDVDFCIDFAIEAALTLEPFQAPDSNSSE